MDNNKEINIVEKTELIQKHLNKLTYTVPELQLALKNKEIKFRVKDKKADLENLLYVALTETKKIKKELKNPKKKYTKKQIPKGLKVEVWDKHFPKQRFGLCTCCNKTEIAIESFECGHIVAEKMGGETNLANLQPICRLCNLSMHTQNLNDYKHDIETIRNNCCVDDLIDLSDDVSSTPITVSILESSESNSENSSSENESFEDATDQINLTVTNENIDVNSITDKIIDLNLDKN